MTEAWVGHHAIFFSDSSGYPWVGVWRLVQEGMTGLKADNPFFVGDYLVYA